MKTLKEKIEVMQAASDGKEIQILICDEWDDWDNDTPPDFNWGANDYRIKPEPMEFWVAIFPDGVLSQPCMTKEEAERKVGISCELIKVREVIE